MIEVSQLTKDQRVKEIFKDIDNKSINFLKFSPTASVIDPSDLIQIVESVEDRIYFISDSPSFEFEGVNYTCLNYTCNGIKDFKLLMDNNSDHFFIIYNIILTTDTQTKNRVPYMIRGVFVEDPLIKRDKIISQILDEK